MSTFSFDVAVSSPQHRICVLLLRIVWHYCGACRVADGEAVPGPAPYYETVVVDTSGTLEAQAKALSNHATQTGGRSWEEVLPRLEQRSAVLGAATSPRVAAAEWFTRVLNMG